MLLNKSELSRLKAGGGGVFFRSWRRQTVRTAGTLKADGMLLAVEEVAPIGPEAVTNADARAAGFDSVAAFLTHLQIRPGTLYRIVLRVAGDDPRLALREDDDVGAGELDDILKRLARLDKSSTTGPWTTAILRLLADHPRVAAAELAALSGREKEWLKLNVRKLKNLGLTISHQPGYELSPRGRAVLVGLGRKKK